MDIIPFTQLTFNHRYIARWIWGGLALCIPVLNFLSLGFLSRTSRLVTIGGIGLPTWDDLYATWLEGARLLFVFILYNAVSFFLFSSGYFLTSLNIFTAFFGHLFKILSFFALIASSALIPFALAVFAEETDFRSAFEIERISRGIREVFFEYFIGYAVTLAGLYLCIWIMRIPYLLGLVPGSVLAYYFLLLSTYYFTELYKKTSLPTTLTNTEIVETGE